MSLFRDLIVGKESIPSRKEFKYSMLRGQFACIIIGVAFFYILLDTFNGVTIFLPWYALLAGIAFITFILNRKKYYTTATILQLVLINSMVYIFADVDNVFGGVYFYFLSSSIVGLILLHYYDTRLSILFAILPILLAYFAFTSDLNLVQSPPIHVKEIIHINFIANLTIGILSNFFVVYFLINRNYETENTLINSEKNLLKISSDLAISEERFALALQGTRAGIYEWRVKQNSIYISPYWKYLLGYEDHELNDLTIPTFISFIHPDDAGKTARSIEEHLNTQQSYQNELRIRTRSGDYKWFQDSGISKPDEEGNASIIIGSIIDIDERKKAEEQLADKNLQLAKTNEELDRFVYSASHDMRAPLSSLLGLIYISEKATNPEEFKEYLDRMKSRVKVMEGFIKDVTDYARNARFEIAWQPIVFQDLITEILDSLNYSFHNEKADVKSLVPADFMIKSDPHRLKIIMNNLLANAIKYADPSRSKQEITIETHATDTHWSFIIQDNGIGISEEHLSRIFEMFFRASENSEGSGLGLYIVKETLEKLNGKISVRSKLHEGTAFTVTLPHSSQAVTFVPGNTSHSS